MYVRLGMYISEQFYTYTIPILLSENKRLNKSLSNVMTGTHNLCCAFYKLSIMYDCAIKKNKLNVTLPFVT